MHPGACSVAGGMLCASAAIPVEGGPFFARAGEGCAVLGQLPLVLPGGPLPDSSRVLTQYSCPRANTSMSLLAENVVNQLILDGKILPEHRIAMIEELDRALLLSSKRKIRRIADAAVELAASKGMLRPTDGGSNGE